MSKHVNKNGMKGYDSDVYGALHDMIYDENIEFYVFFDDKYMMGAIIDFLSDNNFTIKSKENEDKSCIYVNFETGYFKTMEEHPNLEDKKIYELPFDWADFKSSVLDYVEKNPIVKKEVTNKKPDAWNEATTIGNKVGHDTDVDESCGGFEKLKKAFQGGDYKDKDKDTKKTTDENSEVDKMTEIIQNSDIETVYESEKVQKLYIIGAHSGGHEVAYITDDFSDFSLRCDGVGIKTPGHMFSRNMWDCTGFVSILTEEQLHKLIKESKGKDLDDDMHHYDDHASEVIVLENFKGKIQLGAIVGENELVEKELVSKFANDCIRNEISEAKDADDVEIFINLPKGTKFTTSKMSDIIKNI